MSDVIEGQVVESTTELALQNNRPLTMALAKDAMEWAKVRGQILRTAVAATKPEQWQQYGSGDKATMYCEADAGFSMAAVFGLTIESDPKRDVAFTRLPGGVVQCVVEVTVTRGGRSEQDFGEADSFDDTVMDKARKYADKGATPEQIAGLIEVHVRKNAWANAVSRAVSRFLGVSGLSPESLQELGLNIDNKKAVGFKKGTSPGKIAMATISDALKLPKGSHVSIRGMLVQGNEAKGQKGPYCRLIVKDATGELNITMWSGRPEWMETGCGIFLPDVEMGEYQGKPQGSTRAAELVEQEAADANGQ